MKSTEKFKNLLWYFTLTSYKIVLANEKFNPSKTPKLTIHKRKWKSTEITVVKHTKDLDYDKKNQCKRIISHAGVGFCVGFGCIGKVTLPCKWWGMVRLFWGRELSRESRFRLGLSRAHSLAFLDKTWYGHLKLTKSRLNP